MFFSICRVLLVLLVLLGPLVLMARRYQIFIYYSSWPINHYNICVTFVFLQGETGPAGPSGAPGTRGTPVCVSVRCVSKNVSDKSSFNILYSWRCVSPSSGCGVKVGGATVHLIFIVSLGQLHISPHKGWFIITFVCEGRKYMIYIRYEEHVRL